MQKKRKTKAGKLLSLCYTSVSSELGGRNFSGTIVSSVQSQKECYLGQDLFVPYFAPKTQLAHIRMVLTILCKETFLQTVY